MILIRLKKVSANNKLSYAIVATSTKAAATSNKFLEKLGFYKPLPDKWSNKYIFIDIDRLSFWLKRGAKINNSVFVLLKPLLLISLQDKIK